MGQVFQYQEMMGAGRAIALYLVPTRRVATEHGRASVPSRDVAAIWTHVENHRHLIVQSPDSPAEISSYLVPTRRVGTECGRASVTFRDVVAI